MATYGQAVDWIIADLGAGDTSITAIVQQQIQQAVSHYETQRFFFNEGIYTFTTSSSLATYAFPADLIALDSMTYVFNSSRWSIKPINYPVLDALDLGTTFSQPERYATWAEAWRLYPIPNAAYVVSVPYQKRLATLSATGDTNAWLSHGFEMISARVQKNLQATKYKNPGQAASCAQVEENALQRLLRHTDNLASTGTISPG